MKQFARRFYKSKAWQRTRDAYYRCSGGLCEICWAQGIAKAGEIVHHKIELTPDNINDPDIALGFGNLQLVCRECHAKIHEDAIHKRIPKRYKVDSLGKVVF